MAGPDVGTRPRKKKVLTRKKGEPKYKGGMGLPSALKKTAKLQTGAYHRKAYKKLKEGVLAVKDDPKKAASGYYHKKYGKKAKSVIAKKAKSVWKKFKK